MTYVFKQKVFYLIIVISISSCKKEKDLTSLTTLPILDFLQKYRYLNQDRDTLSISLKTFPLPDLRDVIHEVSDTITIIKAKEQHYSRERMTSILSNLDYKVNVKFLDTPFTNRGALRSYRIDNGPTIILNHLYVIQNNNLLFNISDGTIRVGLYEIDREGNIINKLISEN